MEKRLYSISGKSSSKNCYSGHGAYGISAWKILVVLFLFLGLEGYTQPLSCALNGTYTINPAQATGGSNFSSFNEAIAKLDSCGISGDVVFNVAEGTYQEQFRIGKIAGIADTSTVTIQADPGNIHPVELQHKASGNNNNYVIKLDSASYISIKNISVTAMDSIYGRALDISGPTEHILISENNIVSYSSQYSVIDISSQPFISYSSITDNTITGGRRSIHFLVQDGTGNTIKNNTIESALTTAFAVECNWQEDLTIENNYINTVAGGIRLQSCEKIQITGNSIISHAGTALSMTNNLASSEEPNWIINNMISTLGNSSNGIEMISNEYTDIIHNNILMNSPSGNALSIRSQTNFDIGNRILNNNIVNKGGGNIINIMVNQNDLPHILDMNYNNLYASDTANFGLYQSNAIADLADWKKVSSFDSHSIGKDPFFVNDTDLHVSSLNLLAKNPLSFVSSDFDAQGRSVVNPTIGADEIPNIAGNSTCSAFSELMIDSLTDKSLKISWTAGNGNSSFKIEYGPAGFIPGGGNSTIVTGSYPSDQPLVYINGLSENTVYDVYFSEICDSGNDTLKTSKLTVKTEAACPVIDYIFTEAIEADSVIFSIHSFHEDFVLEWGPGGFGQGTGTIDSIKSFFTIDSLSPRTTYDIYVRSDCSLEWFGPLTFTTPCDPSASLSGTYTIDQSQPTGGRNFNSFSEATDALNSLCGVSGPVVFNVKQGVYDEQIELRKIVGASAVNTVTFQPDPANTDTVELKYANTSLDDSYVVRFLDASHITIKGMKLRLYGSVVNSLHRVIHFCGIGKYIRIEDNILEGKVSYALTLNSTVISIDGKLATGIDRVTKYDSCLIKNNTIRNGEVGISSYNLSKISKTTQIGSGNTIENNALLDFSVMGIMSHEQSYLTVSGNTLSSSSFVAIAAGIDIEAFHSTIESNKLSVTIHSNIFQTIGAYVQGEDLLIKNNMIRMQGNSPGEVKITSLGCAYGENIRILNNTVLNNINGSYGGLCVELSEAFSTSPFKNVSLLNNNLIALQNGRTITFHNPANAPGFVSNNNNFHFVQGGSMGTYGTTLIPDLTTWQSTTSLDDQSVSVDPLVVSFTDLHAQSVLINNKGIPIAEVTHDIDGEPRSATAPDIGADEFTPKPCLPSGNFQAARLYSDSIQLSWTPGSGMEFIIEYGTKGFTPGEGTVITGITDSLYTVDSLSPNMEYDFYLKDFCNIGDTSASVGPLTIKTLCTDSELLSGVYTVNSSIPASAINFTTLGEVVSVLNNCGIKDPVTINIAEGNYSQKIALGDIYGTSAVNTVTFQPDPANTNAVEITSVGLQNSNYVIQFNNTRYVTVKGLTLSTGTTAYGTVLNFIGDCRNIIIDSNTISGSQGNPSGVEQAVIKNDNLGSPRYVNDIEIKNNTILYGSYGIYWNGVGADNLEEGSIIVNNKIEDFSQQGIHSYYQDSIHIENNTLITEGTNPTITGMDIYTNKHSRILANTIDQKAGTGIFLENGNKNLLANNMISIDGNDWIPKGISLVNSSVQNVVFNTIYLNGQGSGASCIEFSGTDTAIVYNNNLVNNGNGYTIVNGTSTELTLNHNNLYAKGNYLGRWNNMDVVDLNNWQIQSSQDINSISADPLFIAPNDLHVQSPLLNGVGIVYTLVVTDIDGDSRSATNPDIGADEFETLNHDLLTAEILSPMDSSCGDSNMTVKVQITNLGSQSATGFTVQAELTGALVAMLSQTYTGTLNSGETDTVTLSSFDAFNGGSVNIKAYISYSSDQRAENDTLKADAYLLPSSVLNPQPAQGYSCENNPYDTLYFPIGIENDFSWKTTTGDIIGTGDSLVVGPLQNDTTFILSANEGCYKDGEVKIIRSETAVASFTVNLQSAEATKLTANFNAGASEGANTYTWDFGDGQSGTGSTISHDYTANGNYDVQLIVSGDCGSDTLMQTIEINGISIEENLISRSLEVYPNPTSDKVQVSFETGSSEEAEISIIDLSGKTVYSEKAKNLNGRYEGVIIVKQFAKGTYLLKITSGELKEVRRIIKE